MTTPIERVRAALESLITAVDDYAEGAGERAIDGKTLKLAGQLAVAVGAGREVLSALDGMVLIKGPQTIDTLPEYGQTVLIYSSRLDGWSLWTTGPGDKRYLGGVTHWMPLPDAPYVKVSE